MSKIWDLLENLAIQEEYSSSYNPKVEFYRSSQAIKRNCLIYDSSIIIVWKWEKIIDLRWKKIVYNPNKFLILSTAMQFECTTEIWDNESFLAVKIRINDGDIRKIIDKIDIQNNINISQTSNQDFVQSVNINENIENTTIRLLQSLESKQDSEILSQNILEELIYLILKEEKAKNLFEIKQKDQNFYNITKIISYIHENYTQNLSVKTLSNMSYMSEPTFYRTFKKITWFSPNQYIKSLRLTNAKEFISYKHLNVKQAAQAVWYKSVFQFSREFKRFHQKNPNTFK